MIAGLQPFQSHEIILPRMQMSKLVPYLGGCRINKFWDDVVGLPVPFHLPLMLIPDASTH